MGFYRLHPNVAHATNKQDMTNIRTFIFFSSAILCCWLVASYAYEPNAGTAVNIDTPVKQASSASTETEGSEKKAAVSMQPDQLATMATLQGK